MIQDCAGDEGCTKIDLLFVIDNSGTMGEEQRNLAANFRGLVDQLRGLTYVDPNTQEVVSAYASVNVMVTTTDMGHPLCTQFQPPDYLPRRGAPVYQGCNYRINRFTGLGNDPVVVKEACTANCPADITPGDQYIYFDPFRSNVPDNRVAEALSCIGPQGIDGCGYEAQLESMLQALDPGKCWNNPDTEACNNHPEWQPLRRPFLRDGAILAITIVTDEVECSVASPQGYEWFTGRDDFWAEDPRSNHATRAPTSAVCFNAGVRCDDVDDDGVYEDCVSSSNGVLHPISRYVDFLNFLKAGGGGSKPREIVMLGILGVPEVTARDPVTNVATAGGLPDLVYRDWIDGEYLLGGDIITPEWEDGVTAADKRFEFGAIGPGCTGQTDLGDFTGQALPATRITDVCQSLNFFEGDLDEDGELDQQIRCCVESICSADFSPAIDCLTNVIKGVVTPIFE